MKGALAPFNAIAYERQQRRVLLLRRTEKGTDMPIFTEHRSGKGNGFHGGRHGVFLLLSCNIDPFGAPDYNPKSLITPTK